MNINTGGTRKTNGRRLSRRLSLLGTVFTACFGRVTAALLGTFVPSIEVAFPPSVVSTWVDRTRGVISNPLFRRIMVGFALVRLMFSMTLT